MPFSHTVSDYARHRGCDEKAVRKAIDEGRITAIGEGRARRIDPAVADIQWAQNTRARADSARKPTAAPAPAADVPPAPADYNDHRTRRERAEADMAELERDRQAGNLVRREAAERAVFEAFRALRDACMQSHLGTAQKLLNLADAREVRFILDDGYRAAFENAERTVAQLLAGVAKP